MQGVRHDNQEINLYGHGKNITFLWASGLYTGCDAIDHQHQDIYEALRGVSLLLKMPDVKPGYWLGLVSRKMEEYVFTHFKDEEQLMAAVGYPGLQTHKQHHAEFTEAFDKQQIEIMQLTTDAEKQEAAHNLLRFLDEWFGSEVMFYDKDCADFVAQQKLSGCRLHGKG